MTPKRQHCPVCRSQSGFTMVELMVTMVIFVLAITAASQIFAGLLTQFKQQSKVAETNIEGVIGLELLRTDIEQAGFGLPLNMNGVNYTEAVSDTATFWTALDTRPNYNDAPANPPRALVYGQGEGMNGSDILVVKATNVATSDAAHKYTYILEDGSIQTTGFAKEDLLNTDWVTAFSQDILGNQGTLINGGVKFTFTAGTPPVTTVAGIVPDSGKHTLIYGIRPSVASGSALRMPFNRADYYIRQPGAGSMPTRCAAGTGVLYKATVTNTVGQADSGKYTEMPLLDCVADMQVFFALDINNDGLADRFGDIPIGWTASQIRSQLFDVRVYIVAHEGQKDTSYTYKNPVRTPAQCDFDNVVCINDTQGGFIKAVDVSALTGTGWQNYRWKLYTMVVKPYFSVK